MDWKDAFLYPILGPILKAVLWPVGRVRLPQIKGTLHVDGLDGAVEVLRDRWGVPHIFGRNAHDVVFAQGFVHAQERLWQMDFTRRVISGRLAQVLGEAALPADRVMRTLSLYVTAAQEARSVTGELRTILEAYRSGVNTWIEIASDPEEIAHGIHAAGVPA